MPATVVFLHAHPDDEALLTGGTIARLTHQGHRVLIVAATDGAAGLTDPAGVADVGAVARVRRAELEESARALGAEVLHLGYADSGLDGTGASSTPGVGGPTGRPFASVPVGEAATGLAEVLRAEHATCLVGYDASGGYGHPDHVQVHHVARRAAELAGTPLLIEATLPGDIFRAAGRMAQVLAAGVPRLSRADLEPWCRAYTPRSSITHRVDVRPALAAKRAALAAHGSQALGGPRTIDVLLRLPEPAFAALLGTEWFLGPRNPDRRWYRHPLESLRPGSTRAVP